ncbi:protein kinase domain-containing protein [Planctomicrobium sp. SH668]|uniref:protein kinase domain-containing protein n=1 Tax=Planctomicrobium sp. SH668 TaxID=3448126 RepID=UPI003F5B8BCC
MSDPVVADRLFAYQSEVTNPQPEHFARFLIKTNLLTEWQATKLLQGKHKGFFLGKYKLLRLLGKGGMSSVYLAEHVLMKRRCAIKVLPLKLVKDSSYLQRFHREAQAVASLDHPNIVRAYDIDHELDGTLEIHFLVMEYIDGSNLYDLVQATGPLPLIIAAEYMRQGALGLAHAHQAGMVHRDIKPGNFIVDQNGLVKIMDLGLARIPNPNGEVSLTIAHEERILGTADYLSPEQAVDSHRVDTRADLYSLGCTLYYLLTGRPPFCEGTLTQRLLSHQNSEPTRLEQLRPEVPSELGDIVRRLMCKNREQRTQSAWEAVQSLEDWLKSFPTYESARMYPPPFQRQCVQTAELTHGELSGRPDASAVTRVYNSQTMTPGPQHSIGGFLSSLQDIDPSSIRQPNSTSLKKNFLLGQAHGGQSTKSDSQIKPHDTARIHETDAETRQVTSPSYSQKGGQLPLIIDSEVVSSQRRRRQESFKHWLFRKRFAIAGLAGICVLAAGMWLMLRTEKKVDESPATNRTEVNVARSDSISTSPALPRIPITDHAVIVGPSGHFATVSDAFRFLSDLQSAEDPAQIREIRVATNETLTEAVVIDNTTFGSFPHGIKLVGAASATPVKWKSSGRSPILTLRSVEQFHLVNFEIDAQGLPHAIELDGFCSGTTLQNLKFTNINRIAIAGTGTSGLTGKPVRILDCEFEGMDAKAMAIRLASGESWDNRDICIQNCRFLGPFKSGIAIHGGTDSIQIQLNIFDGCASGIAFEGDLPQKRLLASNNTFRNFQTGIRFVDGPSKSSEGWTLANNLFVDGHGPELTIESSTLTLEQLTQSARPPRFNWTDQAGSLPDSGLFSDSGTTGAPIEFESVNPEETDYLRPKSPMFIVESKKVPDELNFIGAVAPY